MGNLIYPALPGLSYPVGRAVVPPPVRIRTTPSQREFRGRDATLPRYQYSLSYEFLRSGLRGSDLATLVGFYNQVGGPFDSWLFSDPDDNSVTSQLIGTGNGAMTQYQLVRMLGGYVEPVYDFSGTPAITVTDWQGAWQLSTGPRTNLAQWSEDFSQSAWSTRWGGSATVTQDTSDYTAPDGSGHAAKIAATAGGSGTGQAVLLNAGTGYRLSAWVKTGGATSLVVASSSSAFSSLASIAIPASTGWARYDVAYTPSTSGTYYVGLQLVAPSTAYIFGLQLDGNGPPMRYIKTSSAATTVTDYTLTAGMVSLSWAPVIGALLSWSGSFYRRCRFLGDRIDTQKFMADLFEARRVEFIGVKA